MTGREIIDILEQFSKLEWARWGNIRDDEEQLNFPPVMVWRFKEPKEILERKIVEAVENFEGNIKWKIFQSDKNWVLEPERVRTFIEEGNYRVDSHAFADMAKLEPEIGKAANEELPRLAEHIRNVLNT